MQRTLDISRDNDAFHVVFDGVETLDQVEFIRSIGGTIAEGTLLSNAMSASCVSKPWALHCPKPPRGKLSKEDSRLPHNCFIS